MYFTKKYLTFFTIVFFTISQIACKKDNNISQTNTELLTSKSWKLTSYRTGNINTTLQDEFPTYFDCRKDDILSFNSNYIYTLDEGNLKCDPSGSQIFRQGTWEFLENETKLYTVDTIARSLLEIKQLDPIQLKTIQKFTVGSDTLIVEATYVH